MGAVIANTNHLLADALRAAASKLYQPDPYKWHMRSEHPSALKTVICYHKYTGDYMFGKWYMGCWEIDVDGDYRRASDDDFTHWTQCPEYYEQE